MEFEILDHETLPGHGERSAFSQLERKRVTRQSTPETHAGRKRGINMADDHPVQLS